MLAPLPAAGAGEGPAQRGPAAPQGLAGLSPPPPAAGTGHTPGGQSRRRGPPGDRPGHPAPPDLLALQQHHPAPPRRKRRTHATHARGGRKGAGGTHLPGSATSAPRGRRPAPAPPLRAAAEEEEPPVPAGLCGRRRYTAPPVIPPRGGTVTVTVRLLTRCVTPAGPWPPPPGGRIPSPAGRDAGLNDSAASRPRPAEERGAGLCPAGAGGGRPARTPRHCSGWWPPAVARRPRAPRCPPVKAEKWLGRRYQRGGEMAGGKGLGGWAEAHRVKGEGRKEAPSVTQGTGKRKPASGWGERTPPPRQT